MNTDHHQLKWFHYDHELTTREHKQNCKLEWSNFIGLANMESKAYGCVKLFSLMSLVFQHSDRPVEYRLIWIYFERENTQGLSWSFPKLPGETNLRKKNKTKQRKQFYKKEFHWEWESESGIEEVNKIPIAFTDFWTLFWFLHLIYSFLLLP